MKKLTETIEYELEPDEVFDVVKHCNAFRLSDEHYRVTRLRRYVYAGQGGGYGLILSTEGPRILKDGTLSEHRRGGVSLHGSRPDAVAALEAMPFPLFEQLVKVSFFELPGDDG